VPKNLNSNRDRFRSGHKIRFQSIKETNLAVPEILNTIEQTGLSMWLRESSSLFGYYFFLTLHAVGMSLVVGGNVVVDLRILGVVSALPLKPLKRLFVIMWLGLGINVTTGLFLLLAYPTKEFTNIDFYVKLSFVALGVITMRELKIRVFNDSSLSEVAMVAKGKMLAKWSLFFWIAAVTAGRLLSETAIYDTYGRYLRG
jgi:hypothetical protein